MKETESAFTIHEGMHYEAGPAGLAICKLCPRQCRLQTGQAGFCKVRFNREGRLETENYGRVSSISIDPIEKKPLYHFYPGKPILSVGTIGCNLACEFCQNWQISRESAPTRVITPAELAKLASETNRSEGNIGVAYTYSEPGIWYEFLMTTMPLVREAKLLNVLVTNGFLESGPWNELLKWTDAANIDLKGFRPDFYQRLCHGSLQPVLDNITAAVGRIHVELTTLLIPVENDGLEDIAAMAKWIADLDPEIPLHLSRYYPSYKMTKPATPAGTMEKAYSVAKEYLSYVYLGNLGVENDTHCPECGATLIRRNGFQTQVLSGKTCPDCGYQINLVI